MIKQHKMNHLIQEVVLTWGDQDSFTAGTESSLIGFSLITSIQYIFIGIIGEYVVFIFKNVQKDHTSLKKKE
jgi:hypothetical protein